MRKEYEKILGSETRVLAIETRDRLGLTQREMGIRLQMGENSYCSIEAGRTACGALTATLLLSMQEDPKQFLDRVTDKFAKCYEEEMKVL